MHVDPHPLREKLSLFANAHGLDAAALHTAFNREELILSESDGSLRWLMFLDRLRMQSKRKVSGWRVLRVVTTDESHEEALQVAANELLSRVQDLNVLVPHGPTVIKAITMRLGDIAKVARLAIMNELGLKVPTNQEEGDAVHETSIVVVVPRPPVVLIIPEFAPNDCAAVPRDRHHDLYLQGGHCL